MPVIAGLWAFIKRLNLSQIALVVALAFAAMQTVKLGIERRHSAKLDMRVNELVALRQADKASFEKAAADAKAKNLEQVNQIETEQEAITHEVESNLNSRIAQLRAQLLRAQGSADQGSAGRSQAGPVPNAAGGTDETARVCLSPDQFLRGAEYEEKLDQWITWAERQGAVPR